jgi:DNA repair protein RadC
MPPRTDPADAFDPTCEPDVNYNSAIHTWAEGERPREKLLQKGATALSDAELIALIFGSGTRTKKGPVSAVDLGRALGQSFGSLFRVSRREVKELMRLTGIGPAKAAQLAAAFEIGRRVEAGRTSEQRIQVTSPADVAAHFGPMLRDKPVEEFWIVLLNTANVITGYHTLTTGGLAASIVEPRAVFRRAHLDNAAAIICLHNHPSGNPEPSREDVAITKQLVEAGKLMGIPVHDHVIIAGAGYTSLAERGLM